MPDRDPGTQPAADRAPGSSHAVRAQQYAPGSGAPAPADETGPGQPTAPDVRCEGPRPESTTEIRGHGENQERESNAAEAHHRLTGLNNLRLKGKGNDFRATRSSLEDYRDSSLRFGINSEAKSQVRRLSSILRESFFTMSLHPLFPLFTPTGAPM